MNRKNLFVSVFAIAAAVIAGQAVAESPNATPEARFVSSKSRAEVQAELAEYKRAGVNPWSTSYNPLHSFKSTASSGQVAASYLASRDEVAAFAGEDSGSAYLTQAAKRAADTRTTLAGEASNNAR